MLRKFAPAAAKARGLKVDLIYPAHGLSEGEGASSEGLGTLLIPNTAARVKGTGVDAYAPKLFGDPATGVLPPLATFITASPRSLEPTERTRNRPSLPAKPDG